MLLLVLLIILCKNPISVQKRVYLTILAVLINRSMNDMNITIIMDYYLLQLEANKIATNFTTIVITSSSLMHKVVWQTL